MQHSLNSINQIITWVKFYPDNFYNPIGLTQEGHKSCLGNIFHPGDSSDPRLENPLLSLKLTNNYPISDNWLTKIKGKIAVLSVR